MKEKQVTQAILDAAVKVFTQKGKEGARMQEIADSAGVNKMLLHYYYKDKDTLFLEVLKKIVADLYGSVMDGAVEAPSFKAFLSTFIDRHFDFLNERKDTFQFLLWELSRQKLDLKKLLAGSYAGDGRSPYEILTAKLNEAVQKGEIRPVDTAAFITNLFSLDLYLFVALPVIRNMTPLDEADLPGILQRRKKEIFRLLWNDIKIQG